MCHVKCAIFLKISTYRSTKNGYIFYVLLLKLTIFVEAAWTLACATIFPVTTFSAAVYSWSLTFDCWTSQGSEHHAHGQKEAQDEFLHE
uniref:Putative secreted protein n=1 Tax=Xenopsylla cheopis TaxID=163159 RepID=A0A6M2DZS1_XENCH